MANKEIYMGSVPPSTIWANNVFFEDMKTLPEVINGIEEQLEDLPDPQEIQDIKNDISDIKDDISDIDSQLSNFATYQDLSTGLDTLHDTIRDEIDGQLEFYATNEDLQEAEYELEQQIDGAISNLEYVIDQELENKQDKLIAGTNITIDANNVISAAGGDCEVFIIRPGETTFGEVREAITQQKPLFVYKMQYGSGSNTRMLFRQGYLFDTNPNYAYPITFYSEATNIDRLYETTLNMYNKADSTIIQNLDFSDQFIYIINTAQQDTSITGNDLIPVISRGSNGVVTGRRWEHMPTVPVLRTVTINVASTDWTRPSTISSRWAYTVPTTDFEYDDDHMIIAKVTYDNGTNVRLMPHWDTGVSSGTDYEADDCFNIIDNVLTLQSQTNTDETVKITYWEV